MIKYTCIDMMDRGDYFVFTFQASSSNTLNYIDGIVNMTDIVNKYKVGEVYTF